MNNGRKPLEILFDKNFLNALFLTQFLHYKCNIFLKTLALKKNDRLKYVFSKKLN